MIRLAISDNAGKISVNKKNMIQLEIPDDTGKI